MSTQENATAGATGAGDLGWVANLGELSAWLLEDDLARKRFVNWYNITADRLGVPKRVTSDVVLRIASEMFEFANSEIQQVRKS